MLVPMFTKRSRNILSVYSDEGGNPFENLDHYKS